MFDYTHWLFVLSVWRSPVPKYRNSFRAPTYAQHTIVDGDGKVIGTIRIKPSSIQWKPSSAKRRYAVWLEDFSAWITDARTRADRTKS